MNIYEATGRTPEQLLAYTTRNLKELRFRNEPYEHYVYVVCDTLEFAAIAEYAKTYLNYPGMADHLQRYQSVGGLTISWTHMNMDHSVICLHASNLHHYNPQELMGFLNTAVHEQQHMLTRAERKTSANYVRQDEPRAYSTGWTLEQILKILRKRWNITLISVPDWMVPRVARLDELCNVVNAMIDPRTIYSGTLRQFMEGRSNLVRFNNDETSWFSTTYLSGGHHVD